MARQFDVVVKVTTEEHYRVEARSKADAAFQIAGRDPDQKAETSRAVAFVAEVKAGEAPTDA